MWHSMPDRGWAGTMTVTSRLVPRQMCFMKPLYSFGCENKVLLCLGLGKCPTVMFHTTQLLGIYHLQYILTWRWCSKSPKWDIYHPLLRLLHLPHYTGNFGGIPRIFRPTNFVVFMVRELAARLWCLKQGHGHVKNACGKLKNNPLSASWFWMFPLPDYWLVVDHLSVDAPQKPHGLGKVNQRIISQRTKFPHLLIKTTFLINPRKLYVQVTKT